MVIVGLSTGEIKTKLLRVHSRCSGGAARSYPVPKCPTQRVSPSSCGLSESLPKGHPSPCDPQQPEKPCPCLSPAFQPAGFPPKGPKFAGLFSPCAGALRGAAPLGGGNLAARPPCARWDCYFGAGGQRPGPAENPRGRTTFEAPREGAEEGSGHGVHSWPQGAGGGGEVRVGGECASFSKALLAPSGTCSSAGGGMRRGRREQGSAVPALSASRKAPLRRGERGSSAARCRSPGPHLDRGFLFPVFPVKPSEIKPSCLDLIQNDVPDRLRSQQKCPCFNFLSSLLLFLLRQAAAQPLF